MMLKKIYNRLYSDYLMPSRLEEYEKILIEAKKKGYVHYSVRGFLEKMEQNDLPKKTFVHRHDIDTDVRTARKMFEIEKRHGIPASYYFRLSTLDFDLMREIEAFGSEASYHFEEIATFAKKKPCASANCIRENMPQIQEAFFQNLKMIEERLGYKMATVASHGDFANRKLKVINHEILNTVSFREKCGLKCECYDAHLMKNFDSRISDKPYPLYYSPYSIFDSINEDKTHIYFLTHPRQWEVNVIENTKDNFMRFYEGLVWAFKNRPSSAQECDKNNKKMMVNGSCKKS